MQSTDYKKLIEAAILAPTPDNNQPWRFAVREERLVVYLDTTRTLPSDVNSMFDFVGLGAAIENACIAARQIGYDPHVDFIDSPAEAQTSHLRPVASITFAPGGQPDPLYPYLASRCTCRKLYSTKPVPVEPLSQLSASAEQAGPVRIHWVTDRLQISELARLLAVSDLIRFQHKPFHEELYRQLRFTSKEAEQTRDGLDLRTFELPPGVSSLFRYLKPWARMQKVHQFGLGRLLTMPSATAVRRSGAVGFLSVSEAKAEPFVRGGMAFERLWLRATSLNLALQPLGSLPIFLAHWRQLGGSRLSPAHIASVRQLAGRLRDLLPEVDGGVLQIMFRIGHSPPPKFRSLRRRPEEVYAT